MNDNSVMPKQVRPSPNGSVPWMIVMTTVVAVLVLATVWQVVERRHEVGLHDLFYLETQRITSRINDRIDLYGKILSGAAGLFAASDQVTRSEWKNYVDMLDLDRFDSGIQGLGFSLYVPADRLEAHVRNIRLQGFKDYTVKPAGIRDEYSSIVYLEPFAGRNLRAFGYDMFSEPVRRAAMERARDTGAIAASGKVILVQENNSDVQYGFLVYHPVYTQNPPPLTVETRRDALAGWAYAPFRMNDMMDSILRGETYNTIRVEIFDGSVSEQSLMFDSHRNTKYALADFQLGGQRSLNVLGRPWTIRYTALAGFGAVNRLWQPWMDYAAVSSIVLLLFCVIWLLINTRLRALSIAHSLTASLAESEERFRATFEQVAVGIAHVSADLKILRCNRRFCEITGFSKEELVVSSPFEPYHYDADEIGLRDQLVRGQVGHYAVERRLIRKDGVQIWVHVTMAVQFSADGTVEHFIKVIEDVTEKKRLYAELDSHKNRLEQIVGERTAELEDANHALSERADLIFRLYNNAPCGYHSLDEQGGLLLVNDTELAWLGYQRDDMLGKPIVDFIAPDCHETFFKNFSKLKKDGKLRSLEMDFVCKDGGIIPFVINSDAVFDRNGGFIRSNSTVFDDRERRERDRQIASLNAALETRAQEAEAATTAKSTFLATMSHEIRTPMNGIIGMAHLALGEDVPPKLKSYLNVILSSAQRLLAIINDILDISKIEAGRMIVESIPFNVHTLMADTVALIEGVAKANGLSVALNVPATVHKCLVGDPLRLGQVLLNYLNNAVKFTQQGEIRVDVGQTPQDEGRVLLRVAVTDTGIGLTKEQKEQLFQMFHQADASTTRKHGGTGLGLAISKSLCELMGGTVGVDSAPGSGSTFWLEVPLGTTDVDCDSLAPGAAKTTSDYGILRGTRVLLADDDLTNQLVAIALMEAVGMKVDVATNGFDVIKMVQQNTYEVVLMDLRMPDMDGLEATRQIRSDPAYADLPIIAMTADAMSQHQQDCLSAGMNDFISKPFEPKLLYATVHKWVTGTGEDGPWVSSAPQEDTVPFPEQIEGLNVRLGLKRLSGMTGLYVRTLRLFVEQQENAVLRIREALSAQDVETATRHAHTLKGSAGMLEAAQVQRSALAVETALIAFDYEKLPSLLDQLQADLSSVVHAIRRAVV